MPGLANWSRWRPTSLAKTLALKRLHDRPGILGRFFDSAGLPGAETPCRESW
jgi:hypothetical protein